MEYKSEDYQLLSELAELGTTDYAKTRAKAIAAGALATMGGVEYVNKVVFLNHYVEGRQDKVRARQEKKKNRPVTGNPYSRIRTLGKLLQAEAAIRKAVGPRQSAIDALYAQLDSETDMHKRSIISSRLGKKLADKEAAEIKLEQLTARRAEIERDTKSCIEQGRKKKSKNPDSTDGKANKAE